MDKKIKEFEDLIKKDHDNIAGIMVLQKGEKVYEMYLDDFTDTDTIHIASVTKSIISALIGIACDRGYIKGLNQKVLDFFPDYTIKRGEKTIQNITIKDILTMTAPYKYKSEPYTKVYTSEDWTKSALDLLGGKGIIGDFRYSTVGVQILSGIIANATGQSVLEFATEYLFKPIEINPPHNKTIQSREEYMDFIKGSHVNGWIVDFKGANTAGWGLTLTLVDMAKIGQLYLNKGRYNNQQIISQKWIENSTKEHSHFGELPYGYLWWVIDDCFAALGDGGNVIFVCPQKKIVVAIASHFKPRVKDRVELIKNHILPLFGNGE